MAAKRLAVIQSSYIPWKGYFDLIRAADQFVLLDDVQFTKRDWRSRNRIKTKDGGAWLSIPVHTSGRYLQRIDEATISDPGWAARHWDDIRHSYARAPFFDALAPFFEPLYMKPASDRLSAVNHAFMLTICRLLGITTPISWSSDYRTRSGPNERLIDICLECGATDYLSGPSALELSRRGGVPFGGYHHPHRRLQRLSRVRPAPPAIRSRRQRARFAVLHGPEGHRVHERRVSTSESLMPSQPVDVSIVTSLFRSASHLEEFHARCTKAASSLTASYEIVLVNDGSADDSLRLALVSTNGIRGCV